MQGEAVNRPFPSERQPPPHFAGRKQELAKLRELHDGVCRDGLPLGGIVLVDGVQGVGKTQLIDRFASTVGGSVLNLTTGDLDQEPEQLVALMLAFAGASDAEARKATDLDAKITGLKSGMFGVQGERPRVRQPLNAMLLRTKQQQAWRRRSLLVTVDEVQTITAAERRTLRVLHEGRHGCPIMVLCAGLQHSADVLAAALDDDGVPDRSAISRFAAHFTLGPLARSETVDAIVIGAEHFDIRLSAGQAGTLAARSMDFPQHVHGYLEGVVETMRGRTGAAADEDVEAALRHGDRARIAYYDSRLFGVPDADVLPALADAMGEDERQLSWKDALRLSMRHGAGAPESTLRDAVERGVLTVDKYRRLSFGIPSFHSYMRAEHRRLASDAGK